MNWQAFDMKDRQAMPLEKRLERCQAEVKNVLVINRIELRLFDKISRIGELENDSSFGLQQSPQACDEIVRVGRVRQDVVPENEIRVAA